MESAIHLVIISGVMVTVVIVALLQSAVFRESKPTQEIADERFSDMLKRREEL